MITMNEEARSNVAYDYERFERRPAARKPELEVVQTGRAERVAADRQRLALLRTVSMLLVVAIVAAVYLVSKVQVTELTQQISDMNEQLAAAQSEQVRLSLMVEGQLSMSNIEEYAENLGLSKLQQYQVTCVSLDEEDVVTISAHSEGFFEGIVEGVKGFFAGIGAYLGW